jgi:hypothetical protein
MRPSSGLYCVLLIPWRYHCSFLFSFLRTSFVFLTLLFSILAFGFFGNATHVVVSMPMTLSPPSDEQYKYKNEREIATYLIRLFQPEGERICGAAKTCHERTEESITEVPYSM